jgi:hypothetical protein
MDLPENSRLRPEGFWRPPLTREGAGTGMRIESRGGLEVLRAFELLF